MFRVILLDLDGTLTDPKSGITNSIRYALTKLGRSCPAATELEWCIGPPLQKSFMQLLDTADTALADSAVLQYREYFAKTGIFENQVYPGIVDALDKLSSSGYSLMVATSKPQVFAEKVLQHFHIAGFFQRVYGSELDGTRSDKSDLIRYILDQENIAASDAIMIGDRKHDVIGARANSVHSAAVRWGYGTPAEFAEVRPDQIFESPEHMQAYFIR